MSDCDATIVRRLFVLFAVAAGFAHRQFLSARFTAVAWLAFGFGILVWLFGVAAPLCEPLFVRRSEIKLKICNNSFTDFQKFTC